MTVYEDFTDWLRSDTVWWDEYVNEPGYVERLELLQARCDDTARPWNLSWDDAANYAETARERTREWRERRSPAA